MITVTSEPLSIAATTVNPKAPPVQLSECWRWCLQADDADTIITPGSKGNVTVTFPAVPTIPANGTAFKIWGYDFTVDNTQPFTSSSFQVTALGVTTALNFINMLNANLFFNRAITSNLIVTTTFQVVVTWNECREQPRFVAGSMVFTGLTATGGTATYANGVSPEYVEGYRIITRLGYYQDATSVFYPISPFVGLEVDKQCDTVGPTCPEYPEDAATVLYTELPDLTSTSFISSIQLGRSLMRLFSMEYGWIYRESCVAKSGTIKKSDLVLGINAAFEIDDPYQMRRYWFEHPDGLPAGISAVEYLTTQPLSVPLCWDSFAWLWMLNNFQNTYGSYRLAARFVVYSTAGTQEEFTHVINDPLTMGSSWYQPVNFNVSPQFVVDNTPTFTAANITKYLVQVIGIEQLSGTVIFNATEYQEYVPGHCCKGTTDIYFLTPPGGIGTMVVDIDEREIVQDGQEINLQVNCTNGRLDKGRYGGRTKVNIRNYERVSFTVRAPATMEWRRWLKHFRASPQHWIRVEDEAGLTDFVTDGDPLAKKLFLEPGAGRIYATGEGIVFTATGFIADIPTQTGVEP